MIVLPDLPKQIQKREAAFGLKFIKWWEANPFLGTFELKHSLGKDSIPFSVVKDIQIDIGKKANGKGVILRLTVATIGSPDYIGLKGMPVWIVIKYPKAFHVISIDGFLAEKKKSKRKSLTEKRAGDIATYSVKTYYTK